MLSNNGGALPETRIDGSTIVAAGTKLPKWFAAYTMSRHEKRIAEQCLHLGIEHFLPLYTVRKTWKNRVRVDVELPLFPNYIFVRLSPGAHSPLLRLGGILSMVGNAAGSVAIPETEMDTLRLMVGSQTVAPYPWLHVGDAVRIKRGPLEGIAGSVLRSKNGWRFILTLGLIGKSVCVDVEASDLELLGPEAVLTANTHPAFVQGTRQN